MRQKTVYARSRIDKLLSATSLYPLTVVVAGAGYGKTTAALEYLKKSGVKYAWVTPTNGDREVFWDKLASAIEPIDASVAAQMRLIGFPADAWEMYRVVKLARERSLRPFVICVDDYHLFADDSPVHTLL